MAFIKFLCLGWMYFAARALAVDPEEIYDGGFGASNSTSILLKIGNGGAGQSGLVKGTLHQMTQELEL